MKRVFAVLVAGALVATGLVGCSVRPQTSQCAFIIQNGFQRDHGVKKIVYPNQSVHKGGNDDVWYVPCNARNYTISPSGQAGDSHDSIVGMTGPSKDGKKPGNQVTVWLQAHWTLNESRSTMIDFWAFCQKYTCQSANQNDNSGANSSTPGWNNMLNENMWHAIQRAVQDVAPKFDADIWQKPEEYPAFEEALSGVILQELRKSVAPFTDDFFCADGTTTREGKPCSPPTFTIDKIDPTNPALRGIQNQQSEMDAQSAQNAQRLNQAKQLYGPYANWELAQSDLIDKCKADGQTCTVILGGSGGISVSAPQPK